MNRRHRANGSQTSGSSNDAHIALNHTGVTGLVQRKRRSGTTELISDPVLFGDLSPGPDFLFGTGDEVTITGLNTSRHAYYSEFDLAPGAIFSVAGGSWDQVYDKATGNFRYTANTQVGTFNCPAALGCVPESINAPFLSSLTNFPGPLPSPSVNGGAPAGVQTFAYELDSLVSDGTTFRTTGTSYLLFPGQDAGALFGAQIAAHFDEILKSATLPSDPVLVFFEQTFAGIAGPGTGFTGHESGTAFLANQVVVPIPPALPFLLVGFGLAALRPPGKGPMGAPRRITVQDRTALSVRLKTS